MAPRPAKSGKKDDEDNVGIVKKVSRLLTGEKPKRKIPGFLYRLQHALRLHWRGLIGIILPIILVPIFFERYNNAKKVEIMWWLMAWLMVVRPVNIPVSGLIPIFYLPLTGVVKSAKTCGCYLNDTIVLYFLSSMLLLLLNNSGQDRRIALAIMTAGKTEKFSGKSMTFKCATAAFVLSMFSNRLIVTSMITEYFTRAMITTEAKYAGARQEPEIREIRHVVNNAIQTSSIIGSLAIVHSSPATLCFRSLFSENIVDKFRRNEYPDLFNYLQYSAFAVPVCITIFVLNLLYHLYLVEWKGDGDLTKLSMAQVQKSLLANKAQLPAKVSLHEILSILGVVLSLAAHMTRFSTWWRGWSFHDTAFESGDYIPAVKDCTVAAIFVVLLHSLPNSLGFLKCLTATRRRDLPPAKPASGILWWMYVDKNVHYANFFIFGSGTALLYSAIQTQLCRVMSEHVTFITSQAWNLGIFLIILMSSIFSNISSASATVVLFLPFILCTSKKAAQPWPVRTYLSALGVGMSCSFSFSFPNLYSPAYFCHYVGKVPTKKMFAYSLVTHIIAILVLWVAVAFYAPVIWDPENKGVVFYNTTTKAPEGAAPAPPPE